MSWIVDAASGLSSEQIHRLTSLEIAPQLSFALAVPTLAYLLASTGIEALVREKFAALNPDDPDSVMLTCFTSRSLLLKTPFPDDLERELSLAYAQLSQQADLPEALVSVRPWGASSHEGGRYRGLDAVRRAVAVSYADHLTQCVMHKGIRDFDQMVAGAPQVVVAQAMGWSCSGVMTNFEPRTGAQDFIVIVSSWGLAEDILRKELGRDEFVLHKPCLRQGHQALVRQRAGHKEFRLDFDIDAGRMRHGEVSHERRRELTLLPQEALRLGQAALLFDDPVEIDWGMEEGWSRGLHLLGMRPAAPPSVRPMRVYQMRAHGRTLVQGKAVGSGVATGKVRVIDSREQLGDFQADEILVSRRTEPDWEPVFRQAAAIVTEADTRVSHSTILARELGIPALLEASGSSLFLQDGQVVTVSCCEGPQGSVYDGPADVELSEYTASHRPQLKAALMLSLSMPERALAESRRPWAGAGLVRSEFMLSGWVRIHPMALCFPERLPSEVRATVQRLCRGYESKKDYFVDQMSQGIATIASAFWPRPVTLRLSDLKSHEYSKLVGGERFESAEQNPVLGFRGAARYLHDDYRPAFDLELAAIRRVRDDMGLTNLHLMVPFCRTPAQGEEVLEILSASGLAQGKDGLQVWVMAELPSNVVMADQFAQLFDGLSIGSNDLTQLTLGVDRDNAKVGTEFDELDPVMMASYQRLIDAAHQAGKKVGFCGQIASDDSMACATLAEMGVDTISVAPDAFDAALSSL